MPGTDNLAGFPDTKLQRNGETNYLDADEITLIGRLGEKVDAKLARPDEIRLVTFFSFGYLIKIV